MILEYQLKAADVRHQTMKTLTEHIALEANGHRCTTEMVLDVILKASAECCSVEAACQDLIGVATSIPRSMQRLGIEVAIDFHDEPFYGTQPDLLAVACRGKAKKGATHFMHFASAYVFWRQVRLTLALRYVLPDVEKLAVIACPIRGKQGGTCALCQRRKSYRTDYTFTDGTSANLALVATLVPDKTGRRRQKWLAYIIIHLDWTPPKIYWCYRRRFGSECSYRALRQVRARTTSRNPTLRFFLLAVGLIFVNTWIFLRWEFTRLIALGPRRVDPQRFRFHLFARLLLRSTEAIYGSIMVIQTHLSPESVIY